MKKELTFLRGFILVLIAGMLLGSCSKKEEEATDNLVGKWSVSNVTLVTKVGTRSLSQYLIDELDLTSVEAQQMVQMINAMI